ncbi:MAG: hypothetical protein ACKVZ0_17255 [Gemmatimonadales bacterium]
MRGWLIGWFASLAVASAGQAQQVRLAAFGAGSDYREQSSALAFGGRGVGASFELRLGRFGVAATGSRLQYRRVESAALDVEDFEAADLEVSVRVRLASLIGLEAGSIRRWVTPDQAAQSVGATRVGVRADYALAPGADASLRGGLVVGAKFSGGGSAKTGVSLGFGLSYGARRRGVRLVVDYDFLRINRETLGTIGIQPVPLQSSTARLGAMVVF